MSKQDRAIRTRHTILQAAAKVFEEHGYQAATISEILSEAGVTKGALYFHFQSKEHLAQGVLTEQNNELTVPQRPSKLQELVDTTMLHAHRLQTDPMVRASVRLAMDQNQPTLDRSTPFLTWTKTAHHLLDHAQAQGELLPQVIPHQTADVFVGAFGGVQAMSQALNEYTDLHQRVSNLLRHLLPSIAQPSIIATLDMTPTRGHTVYQEIQTHHTTNNNTPTTTTH
ncbi:ScbR family autoregulator-binding transcription factor [Streptomyces werraensis]|uniref:ScbR family autoregulator-binding transcription factor n=1 Tax=Streptomyces werraensis TaxID=68284 RepID=UPI00344639DA